MKQVSKWGSVFAVLGFMSLAAQNAVAGIVSFNFTSQGEIDSVTSCGLGCYELRTNGWATESSGLPGENGWDFTGLMRFYQIGGLGGIGVGTGSGYGWSFTDESHGNNLFGTFTSVLGGGANDAVRHGNVLYTITGGSGWFDGVTGSGLSDLTLTLGKYFFESGRMNVVASVPEPGMMSLFAASLGMLGFVARRRRREQTQA